MFHFLKKYFFFFFGFIALWSPKGLTQTPSYSQLTVEDGLPGRTVYRILQDKKGYIWLGTSNGLSRYNGKTFKRFDSQLLKDKEILHLELDKNDNIWFLNLAKQIVFLKNGTEQFIEQSKLLSDVQILDFTLFKDKVYFFFKSQKGLIDIVKYDYSPSGKLTNPIIEETEQGIYHGYLNIGQNLIVSGRKRKNDKATVFIIKNNTEGIQQSRIINLDISGRTIPSYYKNNVFHYNSLKTNEVFYQKQDSTFLLGNFSKQNGLKKIKELDDRIYYLTGNGIYSSNEDQLDISKKPMFQEFSCNDLFQDQEGNYWIGTANSGLLLFSSYNFQVYNSSNSALLTNEIFTLNSDKNKTKLFFGLDDGQLGILDLKTKNITIKNLDITGHIFKIIKNKKGDLLISSDAGNIILESESLKPRIKNLSDYKTIIETKNQKYIAGYYFGTLAYKSLDEYIENINSKAKTLVEGRTYALHEDFSGKIWVGTTKGVYYGKEKMQILKKDNVPISYSISDISQAKDSSIFIATLANGVLQVRDEKVIQVFNKENGLQSNTCRNLFVDENKIWLSTDNGIHAIDLLNNNIEWINKTDGLPTNDINEVFITNNEVWVGTNKGLVNFPKKLNLKNQTLPPIHITNFKIWEKDTLFSEKLSLTHKQNNFFIGFEGIGFRAKGNISYKYKLHGVDNIWISSKSNFARYPLVNPGDYKFEVYAINEDGIISESPAMIHFSIAPPWWETWWFRILALLSLIGLLYFLFQNRLKNIRAKEVKEQEFKDKVNALRQHALQTQMNPHFVFNALNAIQQFLLTNSREEAMTYLSRFARMVRLIFEHSKEQKIGLDQEVEFLKLYLQLEKLRFKEKVNIEFYIDPELEQNNYAIQVPPLLLQPLIENSFKHGLFHKKEKGLLKIDFYKKEEFMECIIEDDGVGRAKATELSSWKGTEYESSGLKTAKERLAIINKRGANPVDSDLEIVDLFDSAGKPIGTKVTARILI